MFGRKTGLLAAMTVAVMLFGGCGKTNNNLGGAADWYNDSVYGDNTGTTGYGTGTYSSGGTAYWDGYGINSGRDVTSANNTERNTYGMQTDGWNLGADVRRAVDDVTDGTTKTGSMVD